MAGYPISTPDVPTAQPPLPQHVDPVLLFRGCGSAALASAKQDFHTGAPAATFFGCGGPGEAKTRFAGFTRWYSRGWLTVFVKIQCVPMCRPGRTDSPVFFSVTLCISLISYVCKLWMYIHTRCAPECSGTINQKISVVSGSWNKQRVKPVSPLGLCQRGNLRTARTGDQQQGLDGVNQLDGIVRRNRASVFVVDSQARNDSITKSEAARQPNQTCN